MTPGDPERNDVLRLEGMGDDFIDPERNDVLRLEGMRDGSRGLLILINNGFALFVFVIFIYSDVTPQSDQRILESSRVPDVFVLSR